MNLDTVPAPSVRIIKPHEHYSSADVHEFFREALLDPDVGGWCVNSCWDDNSVLDYAKQKLSDSTQSDRVWIAIVNGKPVGYISIEDMTLDGIGRTYGIAIAVLKNHHSKGVGTALIQKILSVASNHKMHIHCITLPINKAMQALLLKNGFDKLNQIIRWSGINWFCYSYPYKPIQPANENDQRSTARASYR